MTPPVRIPADVDREDRVLANLTARQLVIVTVAGLVLYGGWMLTRAVVPLAAYLAVATPIGFTVAVLALGQRDGLSLDRLLLAAVRQRLSPQHRVAAPEGIRPAPEWLTNQLSERDREAADTARSQLRLPAEGVTEAGVVDLGRDGLALVAVASTVNFVLRTPGEQEALVASLGRYLHSLTAPVQVLIRAERLDLSGQIRELREAAAALPHPALEAAAREHADYLDQLRCSTNLLRRQVLLILREPVSATTPTDGLGGPSPLAVPRAKHHQTRIPEDHATRRAAETRLVRRLAEATELLSPAGITITPLDAGQATAVLAAACNPDSLVPPTAGLAGADEVITAVEEPAEVVPHNDSDGWEGHDL